jgi:DNA primase
MARIPAEEIERLKREVSLERLVAAKGVKLDPRGKQLAAACRFCGSDGQTLVITPETNTWRCDGGCNTGGNVLDWVRRAEGVSLRLAVELLRDGSGAFESFTAQRRGRQKGLVVAKSTTTKLAEIGHGADDHVLLRSVFDYYHETLKQSPEALTYFEKRGLKSAEMIERFRLGFANRTLAYRLPQKNRQAGADVRGRLQKLGVLRESGHEHFNGSLVIPVSEAEGRIVDAYGRKITPGLRPGTPLHLWLGEERRGVWNAEAFRATRQVILGDSLINALTFWCAGFRNVTAIAGLDGSVEDQVAAFTKHGIEQVMIAFRRTPEGDRAAKRAAALLADAGVEAFRVVFPNGTDANDVALKPGPGGFEVLLRQAEWLGKGKAKPATVNAPAPTAVTTAAPEDKHDPDAADEPTVLGAPIASTPTAPTVEEPAPAVPITNVSPTTPPSVALASMRTGRPYPFPVEFDFVGEEARPPFKPCVPISGTRLTDGRSESGLRRPG